MVNVLCVVHCGIACALSSRNVISAAPASSDREFVRLWEESGITVAGASDRTLNVLTADGPRPIRGTDVAVVAIGRTQIKPLPAALREFVPFPHVVGLADIDGRLVWLVDTERFRPSSAA